jgi:hypothetical protein
MHSGTYIDPFTQCHAFVDIPPIEVRPALVIFEADGCIPDRHPALRDAGAAAFSRMYQSLDLIG